MRFHKIFLAALMFVSMLHTVSASLSISPLKHEFSLNPGDTASEKIRITNTSDTPITLYTSKEDFIAGDDTGTPTFVKAKDKKTDEFTLSNWIKLDDQSLTLAKGETREVKFIVSVPKDGEPGGHYGAIFFSPGAPSGAQVSVVQRLGVLVLINVSGDVSISGKLSSFEAGIKDNITFKNQTDFSSFPVIFSTKFENDGNVHIKPTGKITLTDENGNQLKNVGKESIVNQAGAFIGEKLVDYIPVNDIQGNVLPKSSRRFESVWQGFGFQELKEDGIKMVKFKSLSDYYSDKKASKQAYLNFWETVKTRTVDKKITASLELSYIGSNKEKRDFKESKVITVRFDEQYVGISYFSVTLLLLIVAGFAYYIGVFVPKSREKLKKQLLEELRKQ